MNNIKIEICCGSIDDCILASKFDIDRIELNMALELGGITPSYGLVKKTLSISKTPIVAMVRPRGAGFLYTKNQIETMMIDAKVLLELGVSGIVFGFLTKERLIDIKTTTKMVELIHSYNKEAIFHKAFDETPDLEESLKSLISIKVNRVLTSGAGTYPNMNLDLLNYLIDKYSGEIEILPGGGVNENNVKKIIQSTNCNQIHFSAKKDVLDISNYFGVDKNKLKAITQIVKAL